MATRSKGRRAATRQDATVRNVRASKKREAAANLTVAVLRERVDELAADVARLTAALRALSTV